MSTGSFGEFNQLVLFGRLYFAGIPWETVGDCHRDRFETVAESIPREVRSIHFSRHDRQGHGVKHILVESLFPGPVLSEIDF